MKHYMILSALLLTLTLSASAQNRDLYIYMDGKPDVQAYENVFPLAPADDPNRFVVDSLKIVRHLKEPTGLRVERDAASQMPVVIWKAVHGATGYEVYKSLNKAPYKYAQGTILQNWKTGEYYFTDNDPQLGENSYRVRARGIVIESPLSSEIATLNFAPSDIKSIDGTYTVTEYTLNDYNEPESSETYSMTVTLDANNPNAVSIYNFWGMGTTIKAVYNQQERTISIPSNTVIGSHQTYGDIFLRGINSDITAYTDNIVLKFNLFTGELIEDGYFAVCVSAGTFGWYKIEAVKDDGNGTTGNAAPRKSRRQLTLKPEALKVDKNQKADCKTMITNPVRRLQ